MYRLYLTTVQNKKDAQKIAQALLKYKAAACVNIVEKLCKFTRFQRVITITNCICDCYGYRQLQRGTCFALSLSTVVNNLFITIFLV